MTTRLRQRHDRRTSPTPAPGRRRRLAALLVVALALVAVSCSDAPTEAEIDKADDGVNPSIVSIYAPERLEATVEQLGAAFLVGHKGISFQYTSNTSETLAERVSQGFIPTLWIDDSAVLAPFLTHPKVQGPPVTFGDDELQFVVTKKYAGPLPTLAVFGAEPSPAVSALCDDAAPCGPASKAVLSPLGITPSPDVVKPSGRDIITAMNDGEVDTSIVYRTDTARLYTIFKFIPLPDPSVGKVVFQSIRFTNVEVAAEFQTWIQKDPAAAAILMKTGYIPRSGPRTP